LLPQQVSYSFMPEIIMDDYASAWAAEERSLATRSVSKIWIIAACIIPLFSLLELPYGMDQFLHFLYIFLSVSALTLLAVFVQKRYPLPDVFQAYGISVIVAGLFSYMAASTHADNVHNYIMGISAITLIRGMLYFGKVRTLLIVTLINHGMAILLILLMRPEPLLQLPNIESTFYFGIIFMIFSFVGMHTRYNLTRANFISSVRLKNSFDIIEEKNKSITESITYAERIQHSILPDAEKINAALPENFIFFQPKDIVSGDFYWFHETETEIVLAQVDCTGHGVPGAFMAVMGYNLLNQVVIEGNQTDPGKILTKLDELVKISLKQNDVHSNSADGMDISLCVMDKKFSRLRFASANRLLIYIRNKELFEVKGDKFPIGGKHYGDKLFSTQEVDLQSGDMFYLFSDGYGDQFGGSKGKKYSKKKLLADLLSIYSEPVAEQHVLISKSFLTWKNTHEQVDDVTVIGFRIGK
jgi:serine phosphatase RsbU (regulator of sigma subunit)